MRRKAIKIRYPEWIKQLIMDSMAYYNLSDYGYAKDKLLLEQMLEQIKESNKVIGN